MNTILKKIFIVTAITMSATHVYVNAKEFDSNTDKAESAINSADSDAVVQANAEILREAEQRATILPRLPEELSMYVGQMILVKTNNVSRVAVGNGKVVEAQSLDQRNLLITGLDGGDSTLHVWDAKGRVQYVKLRVNIADLDRIAHELTQLTQDIAGVTVEKVGERVILDGSNLDPAAVQRLETLANMYSPAAVSLATSDRIRVDRMVKVAVRIVEFSKSGLDDLGVKWDSSGSAFNFALFSDIASNSDYRILPDDSPFLDGGEGFMGQKQRTPRYYFGLGLTLNSMLHLSVQRGNAFMLASPDLTTRSGGEASFLAGGEIPLPALSTEGAGSVEFKEYGIRLEIKPIADQFGNVSGSVMTEVSNIDPTVVVQGIPGLLTRRTASEFSVADGETIVLSGLNSRTSARTSDGVPGLRRIPFLGRAFRYDNNVDQDRELVIFITPRVIDSADSAERIYRSEQLERSVDTGFGSLLEDKTKQAEVQPTEPESFSDGN